MASFWHKLDTVVWIDLPLPILIYRVITRTWQRSQSDELLWGTNRERFWNLFKLWDEEDSLLVWILRQHLRNQKAMCDRVSDPRWAHIQFIRLGSRDDVAAFEKWLDGREPISA